MTFSKFINVNNKSFCKSILSVIVHSPRSSYIQTICQVSRTTLPQEMLPKQASSTNSIAAKRRCDTPEQIVTNKRLKQTLIPTDDSNRNADPNEGDCASSSIIIRKYYPPEMSNERVLAYKEKKIARPIEELNSAQKETGKQRAEIKVGDSVVHWFKSDLRLKDNHSLYAASLKAKEAGIPLIAFYIISPQDFEAHKSAPIRVDFILRSLKSLRDDLAKLHIPLYTETVKKRKEIPDRIAELLSKWGSKHLFANIEYEVDELRREAGMVRKFASQGVDFDLRHDTCVVQPGKLVSGSGNQYSVYTPWFRAWLAYLNANLDLLQAFPGPNANSSSINSNENLKALFDHPIPSIPANKKLTLDETKRFAALWPVGETEALIRLEKFCMDRISAYKTHRNFPAETGTSSLSPYFAVGSLSARTAVIFAKEKSGAKKLDGGNEGTQTWISEVAWRDFYKHVLVEWPYVCMFKPFKPEYSNIKWESNNAHFIAWKEGRTGYPIVDAAMRQLAHTGWMHNRLRMITASFLAKHLLLDWRLGEQFFMLNLIDGDFASNNGGWGWSASSGVDPQPYFRIFNPELQSEKFDKDGEFIRKWVPELKAIKGSKLIHDPYGRGAASEAKKGGYVKKIVIHKEARERCLNRYKQGLGKAND
ncbi:Deoxyribodipyrimidine photo-lyase [Golovinomyces cichoracearum]|uniref:Deoxyribodipyrimidine photo-lyase n=1 Tax=Golovinomyces cichoracearum TaxID=62708 RepID=A0A420HN78_9PEZI|nr:Deoxyribodipyrimidine photo-lyase [Golovinomyces cichoracearum]